MKRFPIDILWALLVAAAFMCLVDGHAFGAVWIKDSPSVWFYVENENTILGGVSKPEMNPLAPDNGITDKWKWFLTNPMRGDKFLYGGFCDSKAEAMLTVEDALRGLRFV